MSCFKNNEFMYFKECICLEKMVAGYDDRLFDGWWRRRGWQREGVDGIRRIDEIETHTHDTLYITMRFQLYFTYIPIYFQTKISNLLHSPYFSSPISALSPSLLIKILSKTKSLTYLYLHTFLLLQQDKLSS